MQTKSCHLRRQSCFSSCRSSLLVLIVTLVTTSVVVRSQLKVTVPKIPEAELETIVQQATLNVKRRLEVIEPSILAAGESCLVIHSVIHALLNAFYGQRKHQEEKNGCCFHERKQLR